MQMPQTWKTRGHKGLRRPACARQQTQQTRQMQRRQLQVWNAPRGRARRCAHRTHPPHRCGRLLHQHPSHWRERPLHQHGHPLHQTRARPRPPRRPRAPSIWKARRGARHRAARVRRHAPQTMPALQKRHATSAPRHRRRKKKQNRVALSKRDPTRLPPHPPRGQASDARPRPRCGDCQKAKARICRKEQASARRPLPLHPSR